MLMAGCHPMIEIMIETITWLAVIIVGPLAIIALIYLITGE